MKKKTVSRWWASCGGISRAGPFSSERAALKAMRLSPEAREYQRNIEGIGGDTPYPHDLRVWSETDVEMNRWAKAEPALKAAREHREMMKGLAGELRRKT